MLPQNLPEDQCIFIRGFRVKRYLFGMLPRIRAAAEPKPDTRWDDREPERQVITIPGATDVRLLCFDFLYSLCVHSTAILCIYC